MRKLLIQFPVNAKALNQAALIAGKLGDRGEQLAHLQKLNMLEPGNEEYRRQLAEAYLSDEKWQAAFDTYQQLVSKHESHRVSDLLGMAKSALKCSEFVVAQEYAGKVLVEDANNGQALAISGYAWNKQGNPDKGVELLKKAIELNGEDS